MGRPPREREKAREREDRDEFIDKLVHINRVSKTVKGGKRFGFAALVVVGDGKGRAGFGHGKAREVPEAISKATAAAKKAMIRVPLRDGRTLHHDGLGHFGAGRVTIRTAPAGTGIIAGGPMRAIFESLGVADVVTKSVGTSNPYNMDVQIKTIAGGSQLVLDYKVAGFANGGADKLAPAVDGVLAEQLKRFRTYATGRPKT